MYCIRYRPIIRTSEIIRFLNDTFLMIRENVLVIMDSNYRPNSVETNKKKLRTMIIIMIISLRVIFSHKGNKNNIKRKNT